MNIYANGCSMVWGKDLFPMTMEDENAVPYPTITSIREKCHAPTSGYEAIMQQCWPSVFARLVAEATDRGTTLWNSARSGASMARILRTTMSDLCHLSPGETFVLVGLTEPQRFEYWDSNNNRYEQVVLPRGSFKSLPRSVRKHAENTAWYHHQLRPTYELYLTQVLSLQSYLQARGFRYLFVNSLDEYVEEAKISSHSLYDQIRSGLLMPDSMYNFCQENGYPFGTTVHPLKKGHKAWGEKVYHHAATIYPELAQAS